MATDTTLSARALWHYGLLALPIAFIGMPLHIYLPDFYATQHGVSLAAMGAVLLAIRAVDALQDPLIGYLSDRRYIQLPNIMIASMAVLAISFVLLFLPPAIAPLAWFSIFLLLATTSFSVLNINFQALGAIWSDDKHDKTRIAARREAIGLIGLLLAAILPALLQQNLSDKAAFHWVSAIFCVLLIISGIWFLRWMRTYAPKTRPHGTQSLTGLWRNILSHRRFYLIYGLSSVASAIPAVLIIFYIRDYLKAENYLGLFLTLYFLSGALGLPLWQRAAKRWGKHATWLVAMLLATTSFIWVSFLTGGDVVAYGIICVASGLALGAELALPPAILADKMEQGEGRSHASGSFSVLTLLAKAALALASAIALPLLGIANFTPAAQNSTDALWVLVLLYGMLPCAFKLAAVCLLLLTMIKEQSDEILPWTTTDRSVDHA